MEKKSSVIGNILSYVFIILLALLIKKYIFSPVKVNGTSMVPTLNDGNIMILNEIGYYLNGVNRFDIVVIDYNGEKLIKRIIGLPGETIEYKNYDLYVNGEIVAENFKHKDTADFSISELDAEVIPDDYYFVVGDNRINSKDSRMVGFIHKSKIMGKTNFVIYPFDSIGTVQ